MSDAGNIPRDIFKEQSTKSPEKILEMTAIKLLTPSKVHDPKSEDLV